jgi:DNA-binding transcriptional LysR family regulator
MSLSLPSLETFYWVAQLHSFNGAAERLRITQPTVSYRIRELEQQLGVSLFIRRRKLALTSEGEALKHYAEAVIGIMRDIETNIRSGNAQLPTLRVGVMDSFAVVGLPALLHELDNRFPDTRVAVTVNTSHDLVEQLSQGLLDIALLSTPPRRENIQLEFLGLQTVAWTASPKLGLNANPVQNSDLLSQRILSTPAPSNLYHLTTQTLSGTVDLALRINYCSNLNVIIRLVEAGSGIGILPTRFIQNQLDTGLIHVIATPDELPMQEIFVGQNKGSTLGVLRQVSNMIRKVAVESRFCQ